MNTYNNIMKNVWLVGAIVMFIYITYKCITEDAATWYPYYAMAVIAIFMYFVKKAMIKRMNKHNEYMKNKENSEQ